MSESSEFVTLARIVKPRGNRGEALARDLCEDPERFVAGAAVWLLYPAGNRERRTIEGAWYHQGRLILKFEGVGTISDAEELRGCEVQILHEDLGEPPEGEHYYVDLIGCEVFEVGTSRLIGTVEAIQEPGGPPLLQVRHGGTEILIPFVAPISVEVDTRAKRIVVEMPEGLEDLNKAAERAEPAKNGDGGGRSK